MTMKVGIFVLASAALGAGTAAGEVRGVQAVLLHCWDQKTSAATFTSAVKASKVKALAIMSAPYLPADRGCAMDESLRLDRLADVVKTLHTQTKLRLITYLGGIHETKANSGLGGRFFQFWTNFIQDHYEKDTAIVFIVGASLEDHYNTQEQQPFQQILDGLGKRRDEVDSKPADARKKILQSLIDQNRFLLVRGPDPGKMPSAVGSNLFTAADGRRIPILREAHGVAPIAGYDIWSNDGPFVSDGSKETCNPDCDKFGPPMPLTAFLKPAIGQYRMLWRPAYNLFTLKKINYSNPGANRKDGVNSGFDSHEKTVLEKFLTQ